ncbi:MAG TPA: tyrosine-type recombinase/integrase [Sedimentibacter sp.]|nr:tyrosine-type recombinase/integrase [Sedimentibacter sp.]HNZ82250.1 tyrosine-type recombinase/integrase [Sedimentibacter sp.]HOH69047.1 tyrosine-type recombinase/integrase [Sedimentibacter sp.]HPW99227.1 tyrosine-type recombinase/integrase [Sedimentibacter sp.]HQB63236.1 tyrosine-type recombinase/integrase [Sedimentibacter sp.]
MDITTYKTYLSQRNLSGNTISSYIYDIEKFSSYLDDDYDLGLLETKKAHILTYLVTLQKDGKSSSTISRTISALKNFFSFLKNEKLIMDNPAVSIHSPKQIRRKPSILTEEEVARLMLLPEKSTFKGIRDLAMLELMYSSGIKVSELINIRIAQTNLNAGIVSIGGDKERIIPLSKPAINAIDSYLNDFRDIKSAELNDFLFINISGEPISRQGIWKILKSYKKRMDLDKELSPQVLRNSFAVHMLSHGADLGTLQELMGLTSIEAAQNYIGNLEFKSLEVFKRAFPRV